MIIPYVQKERDALRLSVTQKVILLYDVFAAHRVESVLSKLDKINVLIVFISAKLHRYVVTIGYHRVGRLYK